MNKNSLKDEHNRYTTLNEQRKPDSRARGTTDKNLWLQRNIKADEYVLTNLISKKLTYWTNTFFGGEIVNFYVIVHKSSTIQDENMIDAKYNSRNGFATRNAISKTNTPTEETLISKVI